MNLGSGGTCGKKLVIINIGSRKIVREGNTNCRTKRIGV